MDGKTLKDSILQMAVQGKLVEQDVSDEPASKLVERIREERAERIKTGELKAPKGGESVIEQHSDGSWWEYTVDKKGKKSEAVCIDEEIPFDIPNGWIWSRLGSLAANRPQKVPNSTFSYIDISSIDNENQVITDHSNNIEASKAPSRARKIVKTGDVLYATVRPYLHNACIVDGGFDYEPIASTGFAAIVCLSDMLNTFLLQYFLSPVFDEYANDRDNAKGMAYPAINDEKFYKALIPVPPAQEQVRIMELLNRLLPIVNHYGELEAKREQLDAELPERLRESLLQAAVQGQLVEQCAAEEPAEKLLERIREERAARIKADELKAPKGGESVIEKHSDGSWWEYTVDKNGKKSEAVCIDEKIPFDIPDSWRWVRLDSLARINTGLGYKKDNLIKIEPEMVRVLRGGNITLNDTVAVFDNDVMIGKSFVDDALFLKEGQIITPSVTSIENIGKSGLIDEDMELTVCGGFVFQITPHKLDEGFPKYLWVYMTSPIHKEFAKDNVKKSGQAFYNFGKTVFLSELIPVPPLQEQQRIVAKLSEVLPELEKIV